MWLILLSCVALADELLTLEGTVPDDGLDHFFVPFEVPEGVAELQVHLDDRSPENILDWGLDDPNGFRGWGGGNTEPAILNAAAASRSYLPGPLPPGTWNVVVGKAKIVDPPGEYAIEIRFRDAPTLPPQTHRTPWVPPAPLERGARWYAGDLHVHSRESGDAQATFDEIADLARARGLDFVVLTEHNTISHVDQLVDAQARHPDVLLIPGIEFTTYDGHANALGATSWLDHRLGQPGATLDAAARAVADQGALLSINHPALELGNACIGCAWNHPLPAPLAAVEVATGGLRAHGGLPTWPAIALWDAWLDAGHRLAAVGGSDDHRAGQGTGFAQSPIGDPTTLVYAEALSVEAILEGIAAGRTVVKLAGPEDPEIAVWSDRGAGIGDPVPIGDALHATVTGAGGLTFRWVFDGQRQPAIPIEADPFEIELTVPAVSRIRAEVHRDGNPLTLTSHLWPEPALSTDPLGWEGETCGCDGSRSLALLPLLLLGWGRRRR